MSHPTTHADQSLPPIFNRLLSGFQFYEIKTESRAFKKGDLLHVQEILLNGLRGRHLCCNIVMTLEHNNSHCRHPDFKTLVVEHTREIK